MYWTYDGVIGVLLSIVFIFHLHASCNKFPSSEPKMAKSNSEDNLFRDGSARKSSKNSLSNEELYITSTALDFDRLPEPGSSFNDIRDEGRIFVDKTSVLTYMLDRRAKFYFMTRPKRFGKTIFVEMLVSFFRGERERFSNLTIANRGNGKEFGEWVEYPVIHIDFSTLKLESVFTAKHLDKKLTSRLLRIAEDGYGLKYTRNEFLLLTMVENLRKKFDDRPVVILIDEYDEPLRQARKKGERLANDIRDYLDGFYKEIEGCRSHLKLVFVTGASKVTLNNLEVGPIFVDLTGENEIAAAMGFEEAEILNNFGPYLRELDNCKHLNREQLLRRFKNWYNNNNQSETKVFNPHSVIEYLRHRKFKSRRTKIDSQTLKELNYYRMYLPSHEILEAFRSDREKQKSVSTKQNPRGSKLRGAFIRRDMDEVRELLDAEFLSRIPSERIYAEEKMTADFITHLRLHNVPCEGFIKMSTERGEDKGDIDTQTTDLELNYVIELKCTRDVRLSSGGWSKSFDSDMEIIKKFVKYAKIPNLFHEVTEKAFNSRKEIMLLGLTIHRSEAVVNKGKDEEGRETRYKIGSWLLVPYKHESKNEANPKQNINIAELRASDPKLRDKAQPLFD